MRNSVSKGKYGYDVAFFSEKRIETIELKDNESRACLLLVPGYQGRVMTSTVEGNEGVSFGWINYKLIESGKVSTQFNPFGGEERLWLGPEGGPFSIYFKKGAEQVFTNWVVPKEIDTESFETTIPYKVTEPTLVRLSIHQDNLDLAISDPDLKKYIYVHTMELMLYP